MQIDEGDARLFEPVTERNIRCAFKVANALGHGFVERKVVGALSDIHIPQCRNYLRAAGKKLCLLIKFGRLKGENHCVTAEA